MKEKYFMEDSDDNAFSLIADFEGNEEQMFDVKTKSGDTLPVLPQRYSPSVIWYCSPEYLCLFL